MLEIPGSVILFTILIHGGRSSINAIYRQFILSLQAFFVCVPADFSKMQRNRKIARDRRPSAKIWFEWKICFYDSGSCLS